MRAEELRADQCYGSWQLIMMAMAVLVEVPPGLLRQQCGFDEGAAFVLWQLVSDCQLVACLEI